MEIIEIILGLVDWWLLVLFLVFLSVIIAYNVTNRVLYLGQVYLHLGKVIWTLVKEKPAYILVGLGLCFILYVIWVQYIWGVFFGWLIKW